MPTLKQDCARRRRERQAEEARVKALVRIRDGHCCRVCGKPCPADRAYAWPFSSVHHIRPKGMGGRHSARNVTSNLVLLCGSGTTGCHGEAEARRLWFSGDADGALQWHRHGEPWVRERNWRVERDDNGKPVRLVW